MEDSKPLAQIAYEAHRDHYGGRLLSMPTWESASPAVKLAWQHSTAAVVEAIIETIKEGK